MSNPPNHRDATPWEMYAALGAAGLTVASGIGFVTLRAAELRSLLFLAVIPAAACWFGFAWSARRRARAPRLIVTAGVLEVFAGVTILLLALFYLYVVPSPK